MLRPRRDGRFCAEHTRTHIHEHGGVSAIARAASKGDESTRTVKSARDENTMGVSVSANFTTRIGVVVL